MVTPPNADELQWLNSMDAFFKEVRLDLPQDRARQIVHLAAQEMLRWGHISRDECDALSKAAPNPFIAPTNLATGRSFPRIYEWRSPRSLKFPCRPDALIGTFYDANLMLVTLRFGDRPLGGFDPSQNPEVDLQSDPAVVSKLWAQRCAHAVSATKLQQMLADSTGTEQAPASEEYVRFLSGDGRQRYVTRQMIDMSSQGMGYPGQKSVWKRLLGR